MKALKKTGRRRAGALSGILAVLAAVFLLIPAGNAQAAAGEQTVTITGHYRDPKTQEIADSGGEDSYALGESMVGSVVDSTGLLSQTEEGDWTLSLRFHLMNNISNVAFHTRAEGEDDWTDARFQEIGTGDDTGDFCVLLPSEETTLKAECYVDAMGRSVVFFLTYGDAKEGNSTDFAEAGSFDTASTGAGLEDAKGLVIGQSSGAQADSAVAQENTEKGGTAVAASASDLIELDDDVWLTVFGLMFCAFLLAGLVLILIAALLVYIYLIRTGILRVSAGRRRGAGRRARRRRRESDFDEDEPEEDEDPDDWDETDDDLDLGFLDDEDDEEEN
ncbi:MAG: heme-binding Shp domain-containing protein [Eubacteriales bacterium]|nr:heme-binding Shp domain-containing protein [Eubacteriales bacterium]